MENSCPKHTNFEELGLQKSDKYNLEHYVEVINFNYVKVARLTKQPTAPQLNMDGTYTEVTLYPKP